MGDREVDRVRQVGYTENQTAEPVANVVLDLLTDFHVDATLLDFPVATPLVHG